MHRNNFDFLRLLFASLVMLTHCYVMTGMGEIDHLTMATKNQLAFSFIGLSGFFSISGFLIYKSLERSRDLKEYFSKRVLRIFPGLIVVLVLSALLGLFLTELSPKDYILGGSPFLYITSQVSLFFQFVSNIDGVFSHNSITGVNSALWTIAYEFLFYIILSLLYFFRGNKGFQKGILIALCIVFYCGYLIMYKKGIFWLRVPYTSLYVFFINYYGVFFFSGAIMAAFRLERFKHKSLLIYSGIIMSVTALYLNKFYLIKPFSLPIIYIPFGLYATKYLRDIKTQIGDISYGVYIYGFLIQQMLLSYFHLFYWQLFVLSIPIAYVIGFLSWKYIEKPFLMKKEQSLDRKYPAIPPIQA